MARFEAAFVCKRIFKDDTDGCCSTITVNTNISNTPCFLVLSRKEIYRSNLLCKQLMLKKTIPGFPTLPYVTTALINITSVSPSNASSDQLDTIKLNETWPAFQTSDSAWQKYKMSDLQTLA